MSESRGSSDSRALIWIARVGAIAIVYAALARLALLLAIPPGYATAVWPAAGVGLAGVLLFGYRVWPGVFAGSLLANAATALDLTSAASFVESMALPAAIGGGAAFQAVVGALLVRRFVGFPIDFSHLGRILGAMLLGGPLACLTSATIGVGALFVSGRIEASELLVSWGTWWLGDAIGVLVVIPLASAAGLELHGADRRMRLYLAVPVLVGVAATMLGYLNVRGSELELGQANFERRAEIMARTLEQAVVSKVDVLASLISLHDAHGERSRREFSSFVPRLLERHRDLQALSWNQVVPEASRAALENGFRQQGREDFHVTERDEAGRLVPAGSRAQYVVISYIEPLAGNEQALGFDLSSDASRKRTLERARDTGQASATPPLELVQETAGEPGFLMIAPIYERGSQPESLEERRRSLRAYVSAVIRAEPLVEEALRAFQNEGIEVSILDTSDPAEEREVYHAEELAAEAGGPGALLVWSTDLDFAGRQWTVHFRPSLDYASERDWGKAWLILTGGLLFASLLGAFLLVVAGRTSLTRRANEELRREARERRRAEEERRLADERRLELEVKVREAQKLESLGVLAGGIAHDFNNLLVGVLGNAALALERLEPDAPEREPIEDIEASAQRAADLANQLLAYSGRGKFVVEAIDLSDLVDEITHLVAVAVSKKVEVRYELARDLPALEADATQIRQVVLNLVTNASEALGEETGVVTVKTGRKLCDEACQSSLSCPEGLPEGDYVFVEVTDTGCGMDETTRAKMFDPFFTTKFTGRGLGLSAVLGIVRGHGGAIDVESRPGEGATVTVLLPVSERSAPPPEERPTSDVRWTGKGTVLLVDDEAGVRGVATRMLTSMGLEVLTAEDGEDALEVFRGHAEEIDLVLLDLTMPRMGGEEALTEIRRLRRDARVVLTSGYADQDSLEKLAENRIAGFIQKPYKLEELREVIRSALGG